MSGQYWSNWAWVMSFEKVREIAPAEMAKFEAMTAAYEEDGGNALHDLEYDDLDYIGEEEGDTSADALEAALADVKQAVFEATGLEIEPMENHKVNDEIEVNEREPWPCFWVRNATEMTREGKRAEMKGLIISTGWVTYG